MYGRYQAPRQCHGRSKDLAFLAWVKNATYDECIAYNLQHTTRPEWKDVAITRRIRKIVNTMIEAP